MKIMPISFDSTKEKLLGRVVTHCRKQGTLANAVKKALVYDQLIEATFMDSSSTEEDKLDAIALVQGFINSHQRVIDLYMKEHDVLSPGKERCDEEGGAYDAY